MYGISHGCVTPNKSMWFQRTSSTCKLQQQKNKILHGLHDANHLLLCVTYVSSTLICGLIKERIDYTYMKHYRDVVDVQNEFSRKHMLLLFTVGLDDFSVYLDIAITKWCVCQFFNWSTL